MAKLRPAGGSSPPTSLIRPAKYVTHFFFKCHISECGQQCNKIGCCLSRKSHGIRPVANSALGPKRLTTPGLHELNRQSQPSRGGRHICELQDQPLTFCERFGASIIFSFDASIIFSFDASIIFTFDASIIFSTGSPACTRSKHIEEEKISRYYVSPQTIGSVCCK